MAEVGEGRGCISLLTAMVVLVEIAGLPTEIVYSSPLLGALLSLDNVWLGASELPFRLMLVLGDGVRVIVGVEVGIGLGVGSGRACDVLGPMETEADNLTPTVFVRSETGIFTPGGP